MMEFQIVWRCGDLDMVTAWILARPVMAGPTIGIDVLSVSTGNITVVQILRRVTTVLTGIGVNRIADAGGSLHQISVFNNLQCICMVTGTTPDATVIFTKGMAQRGLLTCFNMVTSSAFPLVFAILQASLFLQGIPLGKTMARCFGNKLPMKNLAIEAFITDLMVNRTTADFVKDNHIVDVIHGDVQNDDLI